MSTIEVTVKTLDLKNYVFTISPELTVREFKEVISPQVDIPLEQQRLIYRGRILQDDKKISEYNLANNTVHLVQRPTNNNNNQTGESNPNDEPHRNTRGNADQTGNAIGGIPSRNSAAVRLQIGNDMIGKASTLLERLEEDDEIAAATIQAAATSSTSSSSSSTSSSSSSSSTIGENHEQQMEIVATDDPNSLGRVISQVANAANAASATAVFVSVHTIHSGGGSDGSDDDSPHNFDEEPGQHGQYSTTNSDSNQSGHTAQDAPRLQEMAKAVQDMIAFHERLTPFLLFVQNILRENSLFNTESGELQSVQYAYDTVTSILHYLGHSYHAYSDLLCDFSTSPEDRRLSAPPQVPAEQSIPITVLPVSFASNFQQQPQGTQSTASTHTFTSSTSTSTSQNVPPQPQPQQQPISLDGLNLNALNLNPQPNGFGPAGNGNNPFANLQQSIRNHMMQPSFSSFDILLPNCHSHHRNRTRQRPADLHQHVNVSQQQAAETGARGDGTTEFFETFIELIRGSTWLEILQPYFSDIVQNYLMRGRDSTNALHIKTCARSLAKKFVPFLLQLTNTISIKNEKIAYQDTFSEILSKFCVKLLHTTLNTGPTVEFRKSMLKSVEEFLSQLFAVFRYCFPNNHHVPVIVANFIVENFFVGMPLVFRGYASNSLEKYFAAYSLSAERKNIDAVSAGVIYKSVEDSIDDEISASVAKLSTTQSPVESASSTLASSPSPVIQVPPIKKPVTLEADIDIDDLIASPMPFSSGAVAAAAAKNDSPLMNIPAEWRDTVRHDIQRQLGMTIPATQGRRPWGNY